MERLLKGLICVRHVPTIAPYLLQVTAELPIYMKIKATEESKRSNPLYAVLKNSPELATPLKKGESVQATVLAIEDDKAYFDVGNRSAGLVFGIEFLNARDILRKLSPGEAIAATIVEPENADGYVELSLTQALEKQSWEEVRQLKESEEVLTAKIKAANSGGLITSINNIKAFIPVSQLSAEHYPHVPDADKRKIFEALQEFVGQDMKVKILDFNIKSDKLILSEKEVTDEGVRKSLEKYHIGDVVEVIVSGVADFGVFVRFVDDPQIEGLVHISEIDHKLIDSPKEVVNVDDTFKAQIIEVKDGRVSLSLKALKPNPWDSAAEHFAEGQEIKGSVAKFNPFGALIALGHDLQGLIHISEFESQEDMREKLQEGKEYSFIVSQFKPEEKRIILKLS